MSTVFYRWGAGRDESRVTFDGTHISVFDLKREIILGNRMGNGKDFDLGLFDNVTGEEFKDDNHLIPRSSSLVARRMPSAQGKGRGSAQNYIVGTTAADALNNEHRIEASARDALLAKQNKGLGIPGRAGAAYGSLSKRFDGKGDEAIGNAPGIASGGNPVISTGNEEEDKRLAAFFEQSGDQWERTQEDMALAPGRPAQHRPRPARPSGPPGSGSGPGPSGSSGRFDYSLPPDKEPPQGYICYRCGQKGHWIQNCPINEDPAASDRKRFNRVTGIPRSFLKTVDGPQGGDAGERRAGAMLTADGGFVMAVPDARQWQKQQSIKRRTNATTEDLPYPPELTCPLDRRLFTEAMKTPCCGTTYCEECITSHLLEHDFECPACESKVASLAKLKVDEQVRDRVEEWKSENEGDRDDEKDKEQERDAGVEADQVKPEEEGRSEIKVEPEVDRADSGKDAGDANDSKSDIEEGAIQSSPSKSATSRPTARTGGSDDKVDTADAPSNPNGLAALDPAKMQEMLNPQTMQVYTNQIRKMLLNPAITPEAKSILRAQQQLVQATVLQMQMAGIAPPSRPGGPGGPLNGMQNQMQFNGNPNHQQGMPSLGMQNMQQVQAQMQAQMHMQAQAQAQAQAQQQQQAAMGMGGMGMGMGMPDMMMNMQMGMGMGMGMMNGMNMQQMEQMMMNMNNMGGGGGGEMGMQQGFGGNNRGGPGGRGGFQRGAMGGRGGFRGRGRGGPMGMGTGMGAGGMGHGHQNGMKRGMDEGFEGGPDGKMARVG